jgi:hypothetical protein
MKTKEEKIKELQDKIERRFRIIAKHQLSIKNNAKYIEKFQNEIEALRAVNFC